MEITTPDLTWLRTMTSVDYINAGESIFHSKFKTTVN